MKTEDIYAQLSTIFEVIFRSSGITLEPNTSSDDIDEWSSLTYISLIIEIERHFNIKFGTHEIGRFNCVQDLVESILTHLNSQA